jgi:hypothetical protein
VGSHSTAGLGIGLIDRASIRLPVSAAREQPSRNAYRAATGLSWQMEVSEATSVASFVFVSREVCEAAAATNFV